MALSKTIKGLTVEINGDTTKLGKALRDVEKQSTSLRKELSDVQSLLRYDSSNVDALTQKKELLTKAVKNCADKLEVLREAEKQVQLQFQKGEASEEQVRALQREIIATTTKMNDYEKQLGGTYKALDQLGVNTLEVKQATSHMAAEAEAAKTTQQRLAEALTGTDDKIGNLGKELKTIDGLLKDNSDNLELQKQRWAVMEETWNTCSEKLGYLRLAEAELESQFKKGELSGEQYQLALRDIHRQAVECESIMEKYGNELRDAMNAQDGFNNELDETAQPIQRIGDRVKELNDKYDNLTDQLKDVDRGLKSSADNAALLTRKKELLAQAVDTATERLQALELAQADIEQRMRKGEDLGDAYEELKTDIAKAKAELESFDHELRKIDGRANDMDKLGDETEEAGDAARNAGDGYSVFKDVLSDLITDALQELVELLKEAAKYALQVGMDFEAGMSKVEALLGPTEATAENMERLTQLAMEMGAQTKFSAGESAEAMTYLAQAGWKTEEIMAGLPGVMALAASDGVELATAAEICSDALNSLGYESEQAGKFADILAIVAAESSTNVVDMGYAFQYVGPVAGALGYEMEELGVALGLMANAGIKGEKAGTSLRSLFTNLSKPTAAMATAMEQYGISLTDNEGNMLSFAEVMNDLRGVFSGLTEAQQAELAATLAGKTGMSGLLSIVNASPEEFEKMTNAVLESEGAAQQMADTMQDNLAGDVEKLGGAFDTLCISLTQKFNEPMREAVQAVTNFLDGAISLPEMLESLVGSFSKLADGFRDFIPMLSEMGKQLIDFLINGITTGLPKLIDGLLGTIQSLGQYLTEMAPTFLQFGVTLIQNLAQGLFNGIPMLLDMAGNIIESLSGGIQQGTADFVSNALTLLDGFADKLAEAVPKLIDKGAEFLMNLAKGISQALPEFIARAPEIISKFANIINDNFPKILKKGVEIIWELIKGIIKAIPALVANIPKIIKAIVDVWSAFNWLNLGKKCIDAIGNGIKSLWGWIKGIGQGTLDSLVNVLKSLPQMLLNLAKSAGTFLGNGLAGCKDFIVNAAKSIGSAILNFFNDMPGSMLRIGIDLIKGLWRGIQDVKQWVLDKIMGFGEAILDGIKSFFGIKSPSREFAKIGMYLDQGLAKGILDNADDPLNAANEMAQNVLGTMDSFDGMSVENSIRQGEMRRVMDITAHSDNTMLGKLDKIVSAIERGQVLTIDGKALVGSTATAYDNALGQRRMLAARGAV